MFIGVGCVCSEIKTNKICQFRFSPVYFISFVLSCILGLCINFAVAIHPQRFSLELQADYNNILKMFSKS